MGSEAGVGAALLPFAAQVLTDGLEDLGKSLELLVRQEQALHDDLNYHVEVVLPVGIIESDRRRVVYDLGVDHPNIVPGKARPDHFHGAFRRVCPARYVGETAEVRSDI